MTLVQCLATIPVSIYIYPTLIKHFLSVPAGSGSPSEDDAVVVVDQQRPREEAPAKRPKVKGRSGKSSNQGKKLYSNA